LPPAQSLNEQSIQQLRAFLRGFRGDWRGDTDYAKGIEPPGFKKARAEDAHVIELVPPGALGLGTMPVSRAVAQRKSRREYSDDPLTMKELSFLLWCTQGVRSTEQDEDGNTRHFRTVPSAGARHPFETYLLVNRVDGLKQGLYRFLPFEHALLPLRSVEDMPQALQAACYGQEFVGAASVTFVWAAVPYRTEWRYGYIAHRMIAIEAGHVCQNLYLACESIGVGTCAVLGYDQASMDALIGVDGNEEFTIYMATVGKLAGATGE